MEISKSNLKFNFLEPFSNLDRPSTSPFVKILRPFTSSIDTGVKYQPPKPFKSAALANLAEDD
jgi:hypothetical protein